MAAAFSLALSDCVRVCVIHARVVCSTKRSTMANFYSALDNGDNALVRWFGYLVYVADEFHWCCVREQVTGAYFLISLTSN